MRIVATLVFALLVLTSAARLRLPEYDEAYSIFLTAGDARPAWPTGVFHAGDVRNFYTGSPSPLKIAHDLRAGDVHPPLYFWSLEYWRRVTGPSWFAARMLSVVFAIAALTALAWLATLAEIPVPSTLLIALLSYGFAYTGIVARGFALAQFLNILGMALTYKATTSRKWTFALAGGLAFGAAGLHQLPGDFRRRPPQYFGFWSAGPTNNWRCQSPSGWCRGCRRSVISTPRSITPASASSSRLHLPTRYSCWLKTAPPPGSAAFRYTRAGPVTP